MPAPRAAIRPATRVSPSLVTSLHNTTLPPSPCCVALASIDAPCAIITLVAWYTPLLPCQSPPTSTVAPPNAPVASMWVLSPSSRSSPVMTTLPPVPRRLRVLKDVAPLSVTLSGSRVGASGLLMGLVGSGKGLMATAGSAAMRIVPPRWLPSTFSVALVRLMSPPALLMSMLPPWPASAYVALAINSPCTSMRGGAGGLLGLAVLAMN